MCLELNLLDGVKFHEKLVNQIVPVEVDLASSYISMAVFKEKQYQVVKILLVLAHSTWPIVPGP